MVINLEDYINIKMDLLRREEPRNLFEYLEISIL